jgi:acetoin utilization deacetylase AcuC-like enzyme
MRKPNILVHSPRYNTDMNAFGITTPFALDRGQLVLAALSQELGCKLRGRTPRPLTLAELRLVHTEAYLASLSRAEVWSEIFGLRFQATHPAATRPLPELLDDFRLKSGGTLLAAELALKHGLAANLGAGYHHAWADKGEGFCAVNDIAIAIRALQKSGAIRTALVVDVDFHQGNGTAAIFAGDDSVFTLSIHSAEAWPHEKQRSTCDVPIRYNESAQYLPKLKAALEQALAQFKPDLCIFVQGSDAYEKDAATGGRLMKLNLEQLRQRDEYVLDTLADRGIATALVFSGGYGPDAWRVHHNAVRHLLRRAWKLT